jgi:hypothetical protein
MDVVDIVTPDLSEQAWSNWIRKGKLRDRARARRWRIIAGVIIPSALVICALYGFILRF